MYWIFSYSKDIWIVLLRLLILLFKFSYIKLKNRIKRITNRNILN